MAIFPKRIVQRCIDEIRISNLLSKEELEELIHKKLNSPDPVTSIAHEWEIVVLAALSKVSEIEYEKNFVENGRKPDMFCKLSSGACFLADITAISDRGAREENPVDFFFQQVHEFLNKRGVSSGGIDIRVDGNFVGEYRNQKVKLALPPKGEIPKFIKRNLLSFSKAISSNKSEPHQVSIEDGEIRIRVSYTPNSKFSGGGYLAYTPIYSLTRNPISNRLKVKADQLKKSGFSGITGVILCDGWCESLNKMTIGISELSQDSIIQKFFQSNQRVSFILTITPEEDNPGFFPSTRKIYNKLKIFRNPNARFPITDEIVETLELMAQSLPRPESMPINALRYLEANPHTGLSCYGAYSSMTEDSIKISSRTLVEILAGTLDIDKFLADHFGNVNENPHVSNFFKNRIFEGKMIERIELEKSNNEDDDWIVIKFGEPDSAISPYQ